MKKELHVTVDFIDDNVFTGSKMNIICQPQDVDRKLKYFAALGANRLDWMWDTRSMFYREPFGGEKNRLAYAAKKARDLGMEVHAVIKPFETGAVHVYLPETFPQPENMKIWKDSNGINPYIDPFVLQHPEMCFKRRPESPDPGGPVKTIKLIKAGAEPTRIRKEHLKIWVGSQNGRLEPYGKQFGFSVGTEKRASFQPKAIKTRALKLEAMDVHECLVITLDGLLIPESERYIDVRCSLKEGEGDFWNLPDDLIELYNESGERIPCSPGFRWPASMMSSEKLQRLSNLTEYGNHPEVRALIQGSEKALQDACRDFYTFPPIGAECLDGGDTSCVARGFDEYMPILNPAYPEVRDYWAGVVEECIESEVAGVTIRVSGHSTIRAHADQYGFNTPCLEKNAFACNRDKLQTAIGDGYTELLRLAKEKLKARGLPLSVNINSGMLLPEGRTRRSMLNMPSNVEWQWRRWIEEGIADFVCLKHAFLLDSEARLDLFIDRVTGVATRCGVPVINIMSRCAKFDGPNDHVERQMQIVTRDPRLTAFNLYESAGITRFNDKGEIECSEQIAALVAKHFPALSRR